MSDSEQAVPKSDETGPGVSQTAVMCENNQPNHEPQEVELEVTLTAAEESHSTPFELRVTDPVVGQTATDEGDQTPMSAQQASTTDSEESCSSFIARRLEAMEGQKASPEGESIEPPQKVSISEGLVIVPIFQVVDESQPNDPIDIPGDQPTEQAGTETLNQPSTSALQDPRLLPRELRVSKVITATPTSPEKRTRTFGAFTMFILPPQLEMSSVTEPNRSFASEAYASSEATTAVESDLESGFTLAARPQMEPLQILLSSPKGNISIYGRGPRKILRHYATERHLRKDQWWRL